MSSPAKLSIVIVIFALPVLSDYSSRQESAPAIHAVRRRASFTTYSPFVPEESESSLKSSDTTHAPGKVRAHCRALPGSARHQRQFHPSARLWRHDPSLSARQMVSSRNEYACLRHPVHISCPFPLRPRSAPALRGHRCGEGFSTQRRSRSSSSRRPASTAVSRRGSIVSTPGTPGIGEFEE